MAGLNLRIGINALQATREIRNLSKSLKGVGIAASRTNRQLAGLQAGVTSLTAAAGALASVLLSVTGILAVFGVGAGATKALSFAADFEKSLAELNTLLGDSSVSIGRYEQQLLSLSTTSSKTLEDLTRGLYDVISSGIPAVEGASGAFNVLAVSQRAAVAGLTSTETAVSGITAVLNSYGTETIFAEEVSDKLFTAVKLGRTRFDDLASGIGRVAPIAKEAGVSLDEVLAVFVEITKSGVSPRETITGLRNLLKSLIKPTSQTTEFVEAFNKGIADTGKQVSISAEALRSKGFIGALREISQATGGDAGTLGELFPNIRALLPALITLGEGFSDVEKTFEAFQDSAGNSADAFQKIDVVFSETIAKFISNLGKLSVEASKDVLGSLNEAFSGFNEQFAGGSAGENARKFVNDLVDNFKSFIAILSTATSAVTNFGAVFLALKIGKALGPLSNPGLLTGGLSSFSAALERSRAQTGGYARGVGVLFAKLAGDVTVATTRMVAGTTKVTAETTAAEVANTKFGVALGRTNAATAASTRTSATLSNAVRALSGIMSGLGAAIAKLNTSLASMIAQNSRVTASTSAKTAAVVLNTAATRANSLSAHANAIAGLSVTANLGSEALAFKNLSFNIGVNQRATAAMTAETAKLSAGAANVTRSLTAASLESARLSRNLGVGLVGAARLAQGQMVALQGQFFKTGAAMSSANIAAARAQFSSVAGAAAAAGRGVLAFGGALSAAAGGPIGLAIVAAFGLYKAIQAAFNSLVETGPAIARFGDAWSIVRVVLIEVADAIARLLSLFGVLIGTAIVPLTGDASLLNNSLDLLKKGLSGLAEEARKSKKELSELNKESAEFKENAEKTAKSLGFADSASMRDTINELRVRIDVLDKSVARSGGTQAENLAKVQSGETLAAGNVQAVIGKRLDFSTDDLGGRFQGADFQDASNVGASIEDRTATIDAIKNLLKGQDEIGGALSESLAASVEKANPAIEEYFATLKDGSKQSLLTIEEFGSRLEQQLKTKGGLSAIDAKTLSTQASTNILMSKREVILDKIQEAEFAVERTESVRATKRQRFNELTKEGLSLQLDADEARRRGSKNQEKILQKASESTLANARAVFLELNGIEAQSTGLLGQLNILLKKLDINLDIVGSQDSQLEKQRQAAALARQGIEDAKKAAKAARANDRFQRALLSLERLREEALKSQRGSQLDLLNLEVRRIELEKELNGLSADRAKLKREELEGELRLSSALELSVSKSGRLLDIRRNALTSERVSAVKETFAEEDALAREALSLELERIDAQLKAERRSIANASDDEDAVAKKRLSNVDKLIAVLGTARTSKVRPLIDKALRDAQEVLTVQGSQVSDAVENQIFAATNSYVDAQRSIRKSEEQFSKSRAAGVVSELKSITEAIVADQKRRNASLIKGVKDLRQRERIEQSIKVIASASDLDVESIITNLRAKIESEAADFSIPLTFDLPKVKELSKELESVSEEASAVQSVIAKDLGDRLLEISNISPGDLDSGRAQEQFKLLNSEIKDLADSLDPTMDKMAQRLLKLAKGTLVVTEETAGFGEALLAAKKAELEAGAAADQLGGKLRGTVLNSIRQLRKELASLGFDIAKVFETALSGSFNIIEDFFDKSTSFFSKESSLLSSKIAARLNSPDLDIFGRIIGKTRSRLSAELVEIDAELVRTQRALTQSSEARQSIESKAERRGVDLNSSEPDEVNRVRRALLDPEISLYADLGKVISDAETQLISLSSRSKELQEQLSKGTFTQFNEGAIRSQQAIKALEESIKNQRIELSQDNANPTPGLIEIQNKIADIDNKIIADFGGLLTEFNKANIGRFAKDSLNEGNLQNLFDVLTGTEVLDLSTRLGNRERAVDAETFLQKQSSDERSIKRTTLESDKERLKGLKDSSQPVKTRLGTATQFAKDLFTNSSKAAGEAFDDFKKAAGDFLTKDGLIAFDNVGLESLLSQFGDIPGAFGKVADSFLVTALKLPLLLKFDGDIAENVFESAVDTLANFGEFFLTALPEAFSLGVKIITEGLLYAFQQFISVLTKTLQPIGQAVAAPVSRLLGSLGSAVGVLADTPAEEDRRDRKEALELQRATLAQLQSNGASNETIAQEQARLAALLSTKPRETAAERLESEIERAVGAAKNIAKDLGPLVKQFFTSVTAALPEVIPMLAMGLVEALNEFAAGFPVFFETLVTQLVDQLPLIIDAIIDMLPFLVLALVNAATAIVRRLPDIVTGIIESLVENIPLIFEALADSLPALIGALIAAIPQITGALIAAIPQIIVALLRGVGTLVGEAIKGIPRFLGRLASGLGALISAPFEGFARAIKSFVDGIKAFVGATVGGAKSAGTKVKEFAKDTGSAIIGQGSDDNTAARVTAGVLTLGLSEVFRLSFHDGGNVVSGMRNKGLAGAYRAAGVQGFLNGGMVGDTLRKNFKASMSDDVPALLQTGEAVLNRSAVANVGGPSAIDAINSGAGMSPNLNVNVGINPNAQGLGSAAAALLPFLISSINVSSGDRSNSMSIGERVMGYRAVRPLS